MSPIKCRKCGKNFKGRENAKTLVLPMHHGWVDPKTAKMIFCGTATSEQVVMYKKAIEVLKRRKLNPEGFTKIEGGKA
jgi:hypothetical protein